MDDIESEAQEQKVPAMAKIQCITSLSPWATVDGRELRPLRNDEVAMVPRAEAEILKRNRHAVEVR